MKYLVKLVGSIAIMVVIFAVIAVFISRANSSENKTIVKKIEKKKDTTKVTMEKVFVKGGTFMMGSPKGEGKAKNTHNTK